ncbi:MAG: hypothetical protein U5Q44_01265 [Dehalococcoidia bacterium]|nr:hypothetical protein [Dehalococcoidia bacterium]
MSEEWDVEQRRKFEGCGGYFPATCPACGRRDRIEIASAGSVRPLRHCARCQVTWGLPRRQAGWEPKDDEETTRRALRRLGRDEPAEGGSIGYID